MNYKEDVMKDQTIDVNHVCHKCPLREKWMRLYEAECYVDGDVSIYCPCDDCDYKEDLIVYLFGEE